MNLHAKMCKRSYDLANYLQSELNSDEGAIFANKKYKELLKLAKEAEEQICDEIAEYNIDSILEELVALSKNR